MNIVCNRKVDDYDLGSEIYIKHNIRMLIKHEHERHARMFENFNYHIKDIVKNESLEDGSIQVVDGKEYKLGWDNNSKCRYQSNDFEIKIYTSELIFKDFFVYVKHLLFDIFNKNKQQGYKVDDFEHFVLNYRLIYDNDDKKYKLTFDLHFRYRILKSTSIRSWYYHGEPYGEDIYDEKTIDHSNQSIKPNMNSLFERMYNNIDIYLDELPPCIEEFNPNKRQRND